MDSREAKRLYDIEYRTKNKDRLRQQQQQYNQAHKEEIRIYTREWYEQNRERVLARMRQYYAAHKDKKKQYEVENRERIKERLHIYHLQNKDARNQYDRNRTRELRRKALNIYGHKCTCACGCTEEHEGALTLAHLNNDGKLDRQKNGGALGVLKRATEQPDFKRYTIQCWTCNSGAYFNGGVCPKMQRG